MKLENVTLDEALRSSQRVAFTQSQISNMKGIMRRQAAKHLEVYFHPKLIPTQAALIECADEGFFVWNCPQLQSDFLFICENGGIGLFGGQKRVFKIFLGDLERDEFSPSATFKIFLLAITSVNNIFRAEGFVSGSV